MAASRSGTAAATTAARCAPGAPGLRARTQESIAVSGDGESWFLINASPEIRAQIEAFPGLWPRAKRHSPIAGILFTNGDLDHCLGLLSLRESHPLVVHATAAMRDGFRQGNVLYRTLERFAGQIDWRVVTLGEEQALGGEATKLRVTARAHRGQPAAAPQDAARALARGQRRLRHPRRAHGRAARVPLGRRGAVARARARRAPAPTSCSSTARSGRATSSSPRASARGAPRTCRTGRSAARAAASRSCRACRRAGASSST